MRVIDPDSWERKDIYNFFAPLSDPFYSVTFRIDVTELYEYTKTRGLSFFQGLVWACTEAVNGTEAFLMAVRDGQLVMLDWRDPSFTDLKAGSEKFHIVTMEHIRDIDEYCREAVRLSAAQETFIDPAKESDSLIYYSCLPWVDMTAFHGERDYSSPGALDDSIPRVTWGKYTEENGRKKLCIAVEVNHRFIDGVHIGRFAERLEQQIKSLSA